MACDLLPEVAVDEGARVLRWCSGSRAVSCPQKLQDKEKIFFGIRADSRIFNLYRTLLLEPENPAPGMEPATLTPIPATTR